MIITHTHPDLDAIAGVWLIRRYAPGADACNVVFVSAGDPDVGALKSAAYVVDVGREHDPARGRFDHHQASDLRSAAWLVWDWLRDRGAPVGHLEPLIEVIDAADRGLAAAAQSREAGIHAAFRGAVLRRGGRIPDAEALAIGIDLLDAVAVHLEDAARARAELASRLVWRSDDNRVVAIRDGSPIHTQAAFETGALIVVFQSGLTAIGAQRAPECSWLHIGRLIDRLQSEEETSGEPDLAAELKTWFRHVSGFFAGRGTGKAPREDAIPEGTLETVAALLARDLARDLASR